MTKQTMPNKKKGLTKWTTRDLLVTAVISIVFAILLAGTMYLFLMFIMPLGILVGSVFNGIWFIPPILIAYILRRPGAALLGQAMISIISVPFSPAGWVILIGVLIVGFPIELVFLTTRYRNYHLYLLMIAGIAAGLLGTALNWIPAGLNLLSIEIQIATVVITIVSGSVGGWLAKLLADAIAKTGVLSSYAVGQEMQEEV